MSGYVVHTLNTAPEASREILAGLQQTLGLVPNLAAAMAESPSLLKGFFTLRDIYAAGGFSGAEIQALSIANAVANDCGWCVAFHSLMAAKEGLPPEAIASLRAGEALADLRLAALTGFTWALIASRGAVSQEERERFFAAGFSPRQALDVVLGIAFSLMANYAGHLADPPLEAFLQPHAWNGLAAAA